GEDYGGEGGTGEENEFAPAALRVVLQNVRACDVGGHQIGRELNALERQVQNLRHRAHEQRLGETGDADEQTMASAEESHHQLLDDLFLADDDTADLLRHLLISGC